VQIPCILSLTRPFNLRRVNQSMRERLLIVVAIAGLLGLQFADCVSAMTQDQQSMKCCGSMLCDPSNQSHDCCKSMASSQSPSVLPAAHVTLHSPAMFVADILPLPQVIDFSESVTPLSAEPRGFDRLQNCLQRCR